MTHDDDPDLDGETLRRHPPGHDSGIRAGRRTPPRGATAIEQRRSAAYAVVEPDEDDSGAARDSLDRVVDERLAVAMRRRMRRVWGVLGVVGAAALSALISVLLKVLDAREADGVERHRMDTFDRDLERVRLTAIEAAKAASQAAGDLGFLRVWLDARIPPLRTDPFRSDALKPPN